MLPKPSTLNPGLPALQPHASFQVRWQPALLASPGAVASAATGQTAAARQALLDGSADAAFATVSGVGSLLNTVADDGASGGEAAAAATAQRAALRADLMALMLSATSVTAYTAESVAQIAQAAR